MPGWAPTTRTVNLFVLSGIAAPLVFSVVVFTLSSIQPGYDPVSQIISILGAEGSPFAHIMNLFGFFLSGILTILFGIGIHFGLKNGNPSKIVPISVVLAGILLILAGMFSCNPGCTDDSASSILHGWFSKLSGFCFVVAMSAFAYQYKDNADWKRHGMLSFGVMAASILVWSLFLFAPIESIVGLVQRLGVSLSLIWMALTSYRLYKFEKFCKSPL